LGALGTELPGFPSGALEHGGLGYHVVTGGFQKKMSSALSLIEPLTAFGKLFVPLIAVGLIFTGRPTIRQI
jgi:hypothetical protein